MPVAVLLSFQKQVEKVSSRLFCSQLLQLMLPAVEVGTVMCRNCNYRVTKSTELYQLCIPFTICGPPVCIRLCQILPLKSAVHVAVE